MFLVAFLVQAREDVRANVRPRVKLVKLVKR